MAQGGPGNSLRCRIARPWQNRESNIAGVPSNPEPSQGIPMKEPLIHCPQCRWRPRAEDRWACLPACGTIWNTFWTGGVCPGCGCEWKQTQCLSCLKFSAHAAWYHMPDEDPALEQYDKEAVRG